MHTKSENFLPHLKSVTTHYTRPCKTQTIVSMYGALGCPKFLRQKHFFHSVLTSQNFELINDLLTCFFYYFQSV